MDCVVYRADQFRIDGRTNMPLEHSPANATSELVSTPAEPVKRIERKFFVPPHKIAFANIFLHHVCRPDKQFPSSQINTLYFDSPELDQYIRSESGDFRKDKVRIRWYDRIDDYEGEIPIYLEVKSRRGFASSKRRQRLLVPAENLATGNLGNGIISQAELIHTLAQIGYLPEKPLKPVIMIMYRRLRFSEMFSGVRVSLDTSIRSTIVARDLGFGERDLPLRGGVIEVKSPSFELPPTLRNMKLLNTDWSRFSKYGNCIDVHLLQPGSQGRQWPSGRFAQG